MLPKHGQTQKIWNIGFTTIPTIWTNIRRHSRKCCKSSWFSCLVISKLVFWVTDAHKQCKHKTGKTEETTKTRFKTCSEIYEEVPRIMFFVCFCVFYSFFSQCFQNTLKTNFKITTIQNIWKICEEIVIYCFWVLNVFKAMFQHCKNLGTQRNTNNTSRYMQTSFQTFRIFCFSFFNSYCFWINVAKTL